MGHSKVVPTYRENEGSLQGKGSVDLRCQVWYNSLKLQGLKKFVQNLNANRKIHLKGLLYELFPATLGT